MASTKARVGEPSKGSLHYAASNGDAKEVIRLLSLDPGLVDEQDYDKRTALHVAAANGHVNVLEALCAREADLHKLDRWNRSALADAMAGNHTEAVNFLRQRLGAGSPEKDGAPMLLKQVSFKHVDPATPLGKLLAASSEGDVTTIRDLLSQRRVDVNECDDDRRTAAHIAASEGNLTVLKVLASFNADMNIKDRMGNRPLDDAMRGKFNDCSSFLITRGGIRSSGNNQAVAGSGSPPLPPTISVRQMSKDALAELHNRGVREFWSWDQSDFVLDKEPFAQGAGGQVYKCRFKNMVCVAKTLGKLQSRQNLVDLSNEIVLMSSIRHPNIVTFFGACFQLEEPIMLLEFCAGGNLESRILRAYTQDTSRRIKLTESQRLKYAHQMALAMTFLHDFHIPIIHRDLKPGNVLLTATDDIKITDFGLAKFIPLQLDKTSSEPFTLTGETGSYRFMAPEVYEHRPYDGSVDMYSYAMIVYWLFTGVRPFVDCRDGQEAVKLACNKVRPDTTLLGDRQIVELCEQGWAHDPQMRPCFSTVADKLEDCIVHGLTKVRRPSFAAKTIKSLTGGKSVHGKAKSAASGSESEGRNGSETQEESKQDSETSQRPSTKPASPMVGPSVAPKRKSIFISLFST